MIFFSVGQENGNMRATLIVRGCGAILGIIILVFFQITTSYAAKGSSVDDRVLMPNSCSEDSSIFPVFIYTKIGVSKNGYFSDFEVYISDKHGVCSKRLYSSRIANI